MFQALKGGVKTRHMSSFRMSRPRGLPNFVLLFIRTHGEFTVDENSFTVEPPQALLLAPNTGYSYGNPFGDYKVPPIVKTRILISSEHLVQAA